MPTIGSQFIGNSEVTELSYPDINTVPFGEKTFLSRQWHEGQEETARFLDKQELEQERKKMLAEGEKLRAEAGFPLLSEIRNV